MDMLLQVKTQARSSLSEFKGIGSPEVPSVAWNVIMIQVTCRKLNLLYCRPVSDIIPAEGGGI